MQLPTHSARLVAALLVVIIQFPCSKCSAQRSDSFEGGEPRWRLVESDCGAELTEHAISLLRPHRGQTSEMFEVDCSPGTIVLLAYPIEPCAIVDEFHPSVWTLCASGRIQIGVRIVFPFASHPTTGGRISTILWGDAYTDTGAWQALAVTEMLEKHGEAIIGLRSRFGANVNLDGVYIDSLVVNAYTGPGRYRLQLDDMNLRGVVPMAAVGKPPPADWKQQWQWRYDLPTTGERFWATPNRPPVWLQYQGESLPWIASLGFSGVVTNKLPSEEWLRQTKQAGLSVISPPPPYAVEYPKELLPTLKGWLIGSALDSRQVSIARERALLTTSLPKQLRRPLVAEALEDYFRYSQLADELVVPVPIPTSAGLPLEKHAWLTGKLATTRQRGDGWTSVNIGVNPRLEQQIEFAQELLDPNSETNGPVANPLGLRHQVTGAIIAGTKGILLRTFRPLNISRPGDRAHVAALRWINNDLRLWGPWIVGGQSVQPPSISDPNWISAAWSVSQSHLIVAQTSAPSTQYCLPDTSRGSIELGFSSSASGQQVFRITGGTLQRVDETRSAAGIQFTVDAPAPIESFLITSNPVVMRFVRERLSGSRVQNAADQLEIVDYNLGFAAQVVEVRFQAEMIESNDARSNPQTRQLNMAVRQLEQGWQALRSDQPAAATQLMYSASGAVQSILSDAYHVATRNLSTPQASPFVVTPAALSLHWKLADACARSQWTELSLPGSEFAELTSLNEWSQERRLQDKVDLRVELLPPVEGRPRGLRLAAYRKPNSAGLAGGYEGASLRVRSASTQVEKGQLVRLSANAHVLSSSGQPGSGLLVYDNQVGPSLGHVVVGEVGETVRIEIYRLICEDGEFRILAECRGECDIVLDSVRADVIEPATNGRRYSTLPADAF